MFNNYIDAALLLVIFVTGFFLKKGRFPYKTGLLTVHRILAIAFIVALFPDFRNTGFFNDMETLKLVTFVTGCISTVGLFVSGGVLSSTEKMSSVLKVIHIVSTILFLVSIGWILFKFV